MFSVQLGQIRNLLNSIHPSTKEEGRIVVLALKHISLDEISIATTSGLEVTSIEISETINSINKIFAEIKGQLSEGSLECKTFCENVQFAVQEKARLLDPVFYHLEIIDELLENCKKSERFSKNLLTFQGVLSLASESTAPRQSLLEVELLEIAISRARKDIIPEQIGEFELELRKRIENQADRVGIQLLLYKNAFEFEVNNISGLDLEVILEGLKSLAKEGKEISETITDVRFFFESWEEFVRPDDRIFFINFLIEVLKQRVGEIERNPDSYVLRGDAQKELNVDLIELQLLNTQLHIAVVDQSTSSEIRFNNIDSLLRNGAIPRESMIESIVEQLSEECNEEGFAILNRLTEGSPQLKKAALDARLKLGGSIDDIKPFILAGGIPDENSIDIAIWSGFSIEVIELLIKMGALPDVGSMQSAIENLREDVVRSIIRSGVEPSIEELSLAIEQSGVRGSLVNLILESGNITKDEVIEFLLDADEISGGIQNILNGWLELHKKRRFDSE